MSRPAPAPPDAGPLDAGRTPRSRRRRRWHIRGPVWFLVVALFLGIVFVLLDRTATAVAQDKVATKLTGQRPFTGRPTVTIRGFPFATQALRGKYRNIEVTGPGRPVTALGTVQIDAHLYGVHIPIKDVGTGVGEVPVDHIDVALQVPTARIAAIAGVRGLTLQQTAGGIHVRAPISVLGLATVRVDAVARFTIASRAVVATVSRVQVNGRPATGAVGAAAANLLHFTIPLTNLGLDVHAGSVTAVDGNLVIAGSADDVTLH